ncbi:MAG TPA: two-component regulator propeller domain-containing protein, partial [Terriglobia bacterium]|nr:two-component regulator propeller domain-containing protein [Terriglobia bacterium]
MEQALPGNSVTALLQDHDGYLWIGTFGGLARFDGERFRLLDATATPGFDNNNILCLYQSRPGILWIGTVGGGVFRLENGAATKYDERHGLPGRLIESLHGDAQGNVWADTSGGLARFANGKWTPYPAHREKAVRNFYLQARDGSMWFRSGTDLVRFGNDGSMASLHVRKPSAFLVQEARDGSVWVGVRDEYRLVRYYQGAFSEVPLPSIGRRQWLTESPEYVLAMTKNTDGELLLITPAGLVRTVGEKLSPPEPVSLPANRGDLPKVRTIVADREGNLWVGMIGKGLVRLRLAPLTAYASEEGLSDASFNTVFQDREGRIWIGGDLLYRSDQRRFERVPGVRDIRAIAQTRDGDLWFGGYDGLYRWSSGVLRHFTVGSSPVTSIREDRDGSLWIGVPMEQFRGGLYRFREGKADQIPGLSGVHQIIGNSDSVLWIDAKEGLFQLRDGKLSLREQDQNLPPMRLSLHQDSTGTFWFTTNGRGLFRFRSGRSKAITVKDGLPTNVLGNVVDDGKGNLWVTSNLGVFRLSMQDVNDFADGKIDSVSPVTYGVAEGMRSSECNGSPFRTTDGRIWF